LLFNGGRHQFNNNDSWTNLFQLIFQHRQLIQRNTRPYPQNPFDCE
jgi:hypothetical protein